ncbi:glycosyltransferase family 39 protein [Paenibacillus cymbidii]|uniref:glycosyltransferase family 39 protein n=1 Tax=Paenibacillus cymbidii TaxID=1639034 RepID=UPI00108013EB|nr:glycosyltransferase family 39 protein [Paenibacillus cymbidii]
MTTHASNRNRLTAAGRLAIALALLLTWAAAFALAPARAAESNLLVNPGFEQGGGTAPTGWTVDLWTPGGDASVMTATAVPGNAGAQAASIENKQANDAKWVQKVTVKPKTVYKLSGLVKAEGIGSAAKGANLSVMGVTETSVDVKDTKGEWVPLTLYGKTGSKQKELDVALRLGGYGSLNTGKAYFDELSLEELPDGAPKGAKVISFEPQKAQPAASSAGPAGPHPSAFPTLLYAAAFFVLYAIVYLFLVRQNKFERIPRFYMTQYTLAMLFGALLLRIIMASQSPGHQIDMPTFSAWAVQAAKNGLGGFYQEGMFADYPPGYVYVLYVLGKLSAGMSLAQGSAGMVLLMKLPAMLADIASAFLVYRIAAKRLAPGAAFGLSALYAFCPALLVNSALWGQIDSFFTLLLLAVILLILNKRIEWAAVLFALTVLIKPQGFIFTPVLLYALYATRSWRRITLAALYGAATFVVLVLPFAVHKKLFWIVDLYKTTLSSYPYASLNAFNLFALTGGNGIDQKIKLLFLPYSVWGTIFIVAAVALSALLYFGGKRQDAEGEAGRYFIVAASLIATVFVLGSKMHERYLFPLLLLLLFSYIFTRDRRMLKLFAGFGIVHFINVGYVYAYATYKVYWLDKMNGILMVTSLATVVLYIYFVYAAIDLLVRGRSLPVVDDEEDESPAAARKVQSGLPRAAAPLRAVTEPYPPWTRKDWTLLGILVALYTVIAMYHLGSLKSPETAWQPAKSGESFVVDLGAPQELERINSFGGIGEGKFNLEFSADKSNWADKVTVENTYTKVFYWNTQPAALTARYVRFTVETQGFTLNELSFYAKGNDKPLPIAAVDDAGVSPGLKGTVADLFDEQGESIRNPTYMNNTYFDEIYHARTAFEHLNNMKPYENTHPPLGKLLIAVGIWLFGMDPFGWRIVGTVFGIAMIPVIYAFGRRLFGKTEYAFIAAFLLTFDFMHFAQTRISTIDVYGVFFIMVMYYYMLRFYQTSFYDVPLKQALKPLALSGLFFGIGAASKWIVIYGGAGLALIFFLALYERYREYDGAKRFLARGGKHKTKESQTAVDDSRSIVETFPKLALKTIAWCVPFFIVIPLLIYSAAFIPYQTVPGEKKGIGQLIQYQKDMYDYHSKLVATHSFGSPWYDWPGMIKPLWFYGGQSTVPAGMTSTIVTMGNPAIWWLSFLAIPLAIIMAMRLKHKGMLVVLVAFFSQYVPWMLVTRLTFIYHFFAMVPFLVLSIVFLMKVFVDRKPSRKKWVYAYMALVFVLFVLFYPALSGMTVSKDYVDWLHWEPGWYF